MVVEIFFGHHVCELVVNKKRVRVVWPYGTPWRVGFTVTVY